MSLGENSLVAAYQGRGQLESRPSGTRVVTFIGGSGGIRTHAPEETGAVFPLSLLVPSSLHVSAFPLQVSVFPLQVSVFPLSLLVHASVFSLSLLVHASLHVFVFPLSLLVHTSLHVFVFLHPVFVSLHPVSSSSSFASYFPLLSVD